MEKCLVTKLNGAVNADLPYFNGVSVFLKKTTGTYNGSLGCNPGQTARLIPVDGGDEIEVSLENPVLTANLENTEEKKYIWVSKYNAFPTATNPPYMEGIRFNIEDFASIDPACLTRINLSGATDRSVEGDLEKLPASDALTYININMSAISGKLDVILGKYPNLGKVVADIPDARINLYQTLLTGNAGDFSVLHYAPNVLYFPYYCTGNIYDAIVGWRQNIGTTGRIGNCMGGSSIRLWSVYPGNAKVFSISWTETTSSITTQGVTTTFDNSGNVIS